MSNDCDSDPLLLKQRRRGSGDSESDGTEHDLLREVEDEEKGVTSHSIDDIYVKYVGQFGVGQLIPYVVVSCAWLVAAPPTLLAVYITALGSWRFKPGDEADPSSSRPVLGHILKLSEQALLDSASTSPPCPNSHHPTKTNLEWSWVFPSFSAVTELSLVCDKAWLSTAISVSFWIGFLFTASLYGMMADKLGRRRVLLFVVAGAACGVFLTGLIHGGVSAVLITVTMTGCFCSGIGLSAFVLGVECVGPDARGRAGIGQQLFWSVGVIYAAASAAIVQPQYGWRAYTIVAALPSALFVLCGLSLLIESPRWLMITGKVDKAVEILTTMARRNHGDNLTAETTKALSDIERQKQNSVSEDTEKKESLLTVFKEPTLRPILIVNSYLWFVTSAVYYGLNFSLGDIEGNFYTNNILFGVVELISVIFTMFMVDILGRKQTLLITLSQASICCVISGVIEVKRLQRAAAILGKAGISAVFALIYLYSGEMQPTSVRSQAIGMFSTCARIGSLTAPLIASLASVSTYLPFIVFGVLGLIACCTSLKLPETRGKNLADSVEAMKVSAIVKDVYIA